MANGIVCHCGERLVGQASSLSKNDGQDARPTRNPLRDGDCHASLAMTGNGATGRAFPSPCSKRGHEGFFGIQQRNKTIGVSEYEIDVD
jgi:hypothetical protein